MSNQPNSISHAPELTVAIALLALATLTFCGCAASITEKADLKIKEEMRAWIGSHKTELVDSLGEPVFILHDGRSGEVYYYQQMRYDGTDSETDDDRLGPQVLTGLHQRGDGGSSRDPRFLSAYAGGYKTFWIDSTGVVYTSKWIRDKEGFSSGGDLGLVKIAGLAFVGLVAGVCFLVFVD